MGSRAFKTLVVVVCMLALVSVAEAQIAGFKISAPTLGNPTPTGADVTFEVIAYGNTLTPGASLLAGTPISVTDNTTFTRSYSHGQGLRPYQVKIGIESNWSLSLLRAISYGDGQTRQMMALALDPMSEERAKEGVTPPNTFRGTFTHTYASGNYTIRSTLTPTGGYGNNMPGVAAVLPLSTGNPVVETMTVGVNYAVSIQPLDPPSMSPYTHMSTAAFSNSFPSTVVSIFNTAAVEVVGSAPTITASGSCPGMATLTVGNLTPGERVSMWLSDAPGSYVIPMGGCAGTEIELDTTGPVWKRIADTSGEITFLRSLAASHCDLLLQALDQDSCVKSGVVDVATLIGD